MQTYTSSSSGSKASVSVTWTQWNNDYITSSSITAITDPWPIWVRGTAGSVTCSATSIPSATSSNTTSIIWTGWVRDHSRIVQASAEDVRRSEEARQRNQAERIRIEGERAIARERAELLLQESLSEQQRAELAEKGYYSLQSISKEGQIKHYRIRRGIAQNINEVDPSSGKVLKTICAHPRVSVPEGDAMLVQKLMLEDPESHDQFLQ